jgi:hypothetical protein
MDRRASRERAKGSIPSYKRLATGSWKLFTASTWSMLILFQPMGRWLWPRSISISCPQRIRAQTLPDPAYHKPRKSHKQFRLCRARLLRPARSLCLLLVDSHLSHRCSLPLILSQLQHLTMLHRYNQQILTRLPTNSQGAIRMADTSRNNKCRLSLLSNLGGLPQGSWRLHLVAISISLQASLHHRRQQT